MELTHQFTVPASLDTTWAAFNDIESVAGCFPGAVVTEVDGADFKGSCKVKLGPIALVYNGVGTFVEKDEAAKKFVVEAKGKDKRGNGTAGALVTATMADTGGSTEVTVVTDLAITGKPAQFGRGVIEDVSNKLLAQFVSCLEHKVTDPGEPAAAPTVADTGSAPAAAGSPALGSPASPGSASADASGTATPISSAASARSAPPPSDDALDLGATVLPILAKAYWKQALAGLVVLAVLIRVLRRR